jgi:choline kinase
MKAVIIAAGIGSRLSGISGEVPKPLTPVAGIPLLERIIETCKEANILDFGLVVGYKQELLRDYFADGKKSGIRIQYIENIEWEKGNGLSVYEAREYVKQEPSFLLLMSDHLFNLEMLKGLIGDETKANLLAVDSDIKGIFDLDDATKVCCNGKKIIQIGKNLLEYNGIDCGMFRLKVNFFRAMELALAKGRDALSDGVRELIATGDMEAHFISPKAKWLDVDTEEACRYAEKNIEIFATEAQRTKRITKKI